LQAENPEKKKKTHLPEEMDLLMRRKLWKISVEHLDEAVDILLNVEMLPLEEMLLVGCKEAQLWLEHRDKVVVVVLWEEEVVVLLQEEGRLEGHSPLLLGEQPSLHLFWDKVGVL